MRLTLLAPATVTADAADDDPRIRHGIALPYGVQSANTSAGRLTATAGTLRLPADLHRVKILAGHDRSRAVGYVTAADDATDALSLVFRFAATPAGDAAMLEADEHVNDGLSVEIDDAQVTAGRLTGGRLVAVALCSVPAWDDARVSVAAESTPDPGTGADDPLSAVDPSVASSGPAGSVPDPDGDNDDGDDATDPADDDDDDPDADPAPDDTSTEGDTVTTAPARTVTAARVPAGTAATTNPRPLDFQGAMTLMASHGRGEADYATVQAALTDIVPANDAGAGILRPAWLGELWQATYDTRDLINAIGQSPLPATGTKVYGWSWTTRPVGASYAGNKTAIASGPAATGPKEAPIQRWAGGNDIDRIYIDRGDPAFRAAYFAALASDYALDSEADITAELVAAATPLAGAGTTLLTFMVAASAALQAIGARLSFVAAAPDLFAAMFTITAQNAPWLVSGSSTEFDSPGITLGGTRIFPKAGLPAGTVLAGDRRAVTFFEDNPPIKVETVNVPNGGIDWALFAYYALLINDARALLSADLVP